jgi:hypothetical protein
MILDDSDWIRVRNPKDIRKIHWEHLVVTVQLAHHVGWYKLKSSEERVSLGPRMDISRILNTEFERLFLESQLEAAAIITTPPEMSISSHNDSTYLV